MQHHAVAVLVSDVGTYPVTPADSEELIELHWPQVGVGEARELSTRAHLRPASAAVQVLIVRTSFITHEAQNALLKLFEEPPTSTRFHLVLSRDFQFLPTLRSRVCVESATECTPEREVWQEFQAFTLSAKLEEIERRCKAKDVEWQRSMKAGLLEYVRTRSSALTPQARTRLHFVAAICLRVERVTRCCSKKWR